MDRRALFLLVVLTHNQERSEAWDCIVEFRTHIGHAYQQVQVEVLVHLFLLRCECASAVHIWFVFGSQKRVACVSCMLH
jgi:hypothetical protein